MSLRKVAAALQTGPASLYAYVDDLRELHALVLDRALGKVELPKSGAPWRERLRKLLESYARVLSASPGLAQLAFGTIAVGPNALRIAETLLGLLDEAGVDVATAAWAVDLLVLYVTAIAAEHAGGLDPGDPEGAVARAFSAASQRDYPHLHAARAHLVSGTGEERFGWAIEVLMQGILQTLRPRQRSARKVAPKKSATRKRPDRDR
jgi:AcrR family transcriptional regulator